MNRLDIEIAVLDGINHSLRKRAVSDDTMNGLRFLVDLRIHRIRRITNPEGGTLRSVCELEFDSEPIFLSALESGNLGRSVFQLILVRIGTLVLYIRNILPVLEFIIGISERDVTTVTVLIVHRLLDGFLDIGEIVTDGLQVAKEQSLVLMTERTGMKRLASEIQKSRGILCSQMSAVINHSDGSVIGLALLNEISGNSTVQRTAEDGINPEMSERSVEVREFQDNAVRVGVISGATVIERRKIHQVGNPDISSLLPVLVEVSQKILGDTVRPRITGVLFGNVDGHVELGCAVGIETGIVTSPSRLLNLVRHEVHEAKDVFPVYPIDFLDSLRLEIHNGLNRMLQIKIKIAVIKKITDELNVFTNEIIDAVNPVFLLFGIMGEKDDTVVQDIPSE